MTNLAAIIPSSKAPLLIHSLPIPTPSSHELLVENHNIGLNAIEAKIARLGIIPLEYPAILGSTFGGTIAAIGSAVENYAVGERVVVSKRFGVKGNEYGAYQRYVLVKDIMVSKVPDGSDIAVMASLMMNTTCVVGLFTGRLGLDRPVFGAVAPAKGTKILVYGGSSSFGRLSVEYLSRAGYEVHTTSSPRHYDAVANLGAAAVVDHALEYEKLVEELVRRGPYDALVDTISAPETIRVTAKVLAAQGGGKLYAMQPAFVPEMLPSGVTRVFEAWSESLYEHNNRELQEWVVQAYLPLGIARGGITPLPVETIAGGLRGINSALARLQNGLSGIRLVANPWI